MATAAYLPMTALSILCQTAAIPENPRPGLFSCQYILHLLQHQPLRLEYFRNELARLLDGVPLPNAYPPPPPPPPRFFHLYT